MTETETQALLSLPPDERVCIANALWNSIEEDVNTDIPAWHKDILDTRLNTLRDHPIDTDHVATLKRVGIQA